MAPIGYFVPILSFGLFYLYLDYLVYEYGSLTSVCSYFGCSQLFLLRSPSSWLLQFGSCFLGLPCSLSARVVAVVQENLMAILKQLMLCP